MLLRRCSWCCAGAHPELPAPMTELGLSRNSGLEPTGGSGTELGRGGGEGDSCWLHLHPKPSSKQPKQHLEKPSAVGWRETCWNLEKHQMVPWVYLFLYASDAGSSGFPLLCGLCPSSFFPREFCLARKKRVLLTEQRDRAINYSH